MPRCTDYNARMAAYMTARYHRRRAEAIEQLGGVCVRCGRADELEFDHIDRTTKSEDIGRLFSRGEQRYRAELKKCQLLCKACHTQKTSKEQSVDHGGGLTGKKNCHCGLCAPLKRRYVRDFKRKKRLRDGSSAAETSGS